MSKSSRKSLHSKLHIYSFYDNKYLFLSVDFFELLNRYLVNQGCIKPMCDMLACPDPRIITVCLEGLENILKVGEVEKDAGNTGGTNLYAKFIEEADGMDKIESLQTHDNNEIYEKAVKILETYWVEDDEGDQTMVPGTENGFTFGGTVPAGPFNFS